MKRLGTHCQFCKKPITVEIDDGYDEVSDPYKLLPRACCNYCADLRVSRRGLEKKIQLMARAIQLSSPSDKEGRERISKTLTFATQEYAKLICKWHRMDGMIWDEGCVEAIIASPHKFGETLSRMWTAFKQWKKQHEQEEMGL